MVGGAVSSCTAEQAQAKCDGGATCASTGQTEQLLLQLAAGAQPASLHKSEQMEEECMTVQEGHPCYEHVKWAMDIGFPANPAHYGDLTPTSTFPDVQRWMAKRSLHGCPMPCDADGSGAQPETTPTPTTRAPWSGSAQRWKSQEGALIPPGGRVRLYVVGTSNVVWQTWPDQLTSLLVDMGYDTSPGNFSATDSVRPSPRAPVCDNEKDFAGLETPRVGKVGWASWGFAFESKDDCVPEDYEGELGKHGFRMIAGHKVSCVNSWACDPAGVTESTLVKPSAVAKDAKDADIVLLSNWMNDSKQRWASFRCFRGEAVDLDNSTGSADLTLAALLTLIRAIHAANPKVVVLVLARYPDAVGTRAFEPLFERVAQLNSVVKVALEQEPNTYFVDYDFPTDIDMFQSRNFGHPNCRGDRVMATSILDVLFERGVLGKGVALPRGEEADLCAAVQACSDAESETVEETLACCQLAPGCIVSGSGECVAYGPGAPGA